MDTLTALTAAIVTMTWLPVPIDDVAGTSTSQRSPAPIVSLEPQVSVSGADHARQDAVADVLQRFRTAGLALPDLDIVFTDDERCRGHDGLFQESFTPWRILVCSDLDYVLAHELAHAWEAANLGHQDRWRYMDRWGFSTWNGRDAEWRDRAEEHAAFVIQQNLIDTSARPDSPGWADRIAAFELLTGRPSPLRGS